MKTRTALSLAWLLFAWANGLGIARAEVFPRLMGMNIGEKHYHEPAYQDDLAKLNFVVLGFYKGWQPKKEYATFDALRDIQSKNPRLQIAQYSVLNEARDVQHDVAMADIVGTLNTNQWWLRNASGERVQWTKEFSAWEVNFTSIAHPDASGKRYPQWLAHRNFNTFFRGTPSPRWLYSDNTFPRSRVKADWDGDGVNDDPNSPRIIAAWRSGYRDYWATFRSLAPDVAIMGNADSDLAEPEFKDQLDGAFLEGLMGKSWSIERKRGWDAMMKRYRDVEKNLRGPRIVGFNVSGDPIDYQFFRYAFTSCLLGDGYFSFTDEKRGYSSVPWFDEYDFNLGRAISAPPSEPWLKGVWRRDFERGIVLVNPSDRIVQIDLEPGLHHLIGLQASNINTGKSAQKLVISKKDGVVLAFDR